MAYPVIGSKIVSSIDTDDILAVLKPIWTTKTETADRVRGRIERILDYAATHHWREGDNPARWKGHLSNILPKPSSVTKVQHHAAIEWQKIQPVIDTLQKSDGISALAVQFLCLCASRSSEVRFARWEEIDLDQAIINAPDHIIERTAVVMKQSVGSMPLTIPPLPIPIGDFDEQFILTTDDGDILSNTLYTIKLEDDTLMQGISDELGRTDRIRTNQPQKLKVYLGHIG